MCFDALRLLPNMLEARRGWRHAAPALTPQQQATPRPTLGTAAAVKRRLWVSPQQQVGKGGRMACMQPACRGIPGAVRTASAPLPRPGLLPSLFCLWPQSTPPHFTNAGSFPIHRVGVGAQRKPTPSYLRVRVRGRRSLGRPGGGGKRLGQCRLVGPRRWSACVCLHGGLAWGPFGAAVEQCTAACRTRLQL
ncbi:hypothetical protein TSOC_007892 [Tetrabaena socialis]|uniref:Uncharacterized protein n=1 Tax=Tetrabaena socialis TaxID=47790 RepID=A0A2J7ZZV5_9CHLO|nr:hypothetical protein TSOC_007892 [Tetrabaena socialis]|eukprot:PNH05817.1 hypothetical protein TSOC_007892 [Tetrabaena socialis]